MQTFFPLAFQNAMIFVVVSLLITLFCKLSCVLLRTCTFSEHLFTILCQFGVLVLHHFPISLICFFLELFISFKEWLNMINLTNSKGYNFQNELLKTSIRLVLRQYTNQFKFFWHFDLGRNMCEMKCLIKIKDKKVEKYLQIVLVQLIESDDSMEENWPMKTVFEDRVCPSILRTYQQCRSI